jgi:hypothetical protein
VMMLKILKQKKKTIVLLIVKNQSDYLIKRFSFLIINIKFLFVENHRQWFYAWDHFHRHFFRMHHLRSQYLSSRYQRSRYQRLLYLHSLYLHSRHLFKSHFSLNRTSDRSHCRSRRDHRQNCHLNMRISRSRS